MSGKFYTKTIKDLSPVLFEHVDDPDRGVYSVARGEVDIKTKTCYDVTTIFPGLVGRELPKTFGHYHPKNSNGLRYPELYEVLDGRAWFIIQQPRESNPKIIEEAYLIEAGKNEKIVIPHGFGHVTINPDKKELKMANWKAEFENDYQLYESLHGAAYYFLELESERVDIEKNNYYETVPELIKLKPKQFPKELENLEFLLKPEKYLELLTIDNCFKRI